MALANHKKQAQADLRAREDNISAKTHRLRLKAESIMRKPLKTTVFKRVLTHKRVLDTLVHPSSDETLNLRVRHTDEQVDKLLDHIDIELRRVEEKPGDERHMLAPGCPSHNDNYTLPGELQQRAKRIVWDIKFVINNQQIRLQQSERSMCLEHLTALQIALEPSFVGDGIATWSAKCSMEIVKKKIRDMSDAVEDIYKRYPRSMTRF